jgi:hypothetical protein
MIDEHVQESAVEGSRAILAWSQGSPLRDAQRSTVATRWHCCAVLASANPIGRVCVCVKTQVECVVSISQKDSCVSAGDAGDGGPGAERDSTALPLVGLCDIDGGVAISRDFTISQSG